MRKKKKLIMVILLAILATDVLLSNFPSAVPTNQTISNAEQNPTFKSMVATANATYSYFGYSNNPEYSTRCIGSVFGEVLHFFSPFHEYTTTSLIFMVQPYLMEGVPSNSSTLPFLLFLQVNPSSGQVLSIQKQYSCV